MITRICFLILALTIPIWAHYGQKFEPPDGRILHGLGQFLNLTFYTEEENWQLVTEYQTASGVIPVIYSTYAYTDPFVDELDSTDLIDAVINHNYPYVLSVGISIFDITSTTTSVNIPVQSFLDGDLDDQIIKIAQEIKNLYPNPVFIRPAFEFGSGNSGLHNDPDNSDWTAVNFIQIWIRIHDIFTQQAVANVAWVWNTVNPQSFNFIQWYPGDEYVDWWGINYFTVGQINSANAFLDSAALHNKPVMICESNPIENGGTTNADNWNDWFVPYFNKITNTSHIKAFIYISDPWNKPGFFDGWPDSRINTTEIIHANYAAEMDNSIYIHMDEYQNNPDIIDSSLPISLASFDIISLPGSNLIEWRTESEFNNLGFNIYKAYSEEDMDIDKLNFYKINPSFIPGAGSSSEWKEYKFQDIQVKDNIYYWYQLEDLDYNGHVTRHDIKRIYRKKKVPTKLEIFQNFPNPFNFETTIRFNLPKQSEIRLTVYSITGEHVATLINSSMSEGYHQMSFNASNIASGIYLYRIQTKELTQVRKMILIN